VDNYKILIGAAVVGIVVMGLIFGFDIARLTVATQDYDVFVDPLKDQQSLFTMARVTIQNTGTQPLTNVKVNFGGGDVLELGTINVGKKILVSPPPENKMEFVQVSADNDVFVSKAYREPPKMVGMMGS
jgi:hypothetical protein